MTATEDEITRRVADGLRRLGIGYMIVRRIPAFTRQEKSRGELSSNVLSGFNDPIRKA